MRLKKVLSTLFVVASVSGSASASSVFLDFEGLTTLDSLNNEAIGTFYDNGTGGGGSTGVDLGVTFSSNANSSHQLVVPAGSTRFEELLFGSDAFLVFESGTEGLITVSGGFKDEVSFYYSSQNLFGFTTTVGVYDDLDNELTSLVLPYTPDPGAGFTFGTLDYAQLTFSGTASYLKFTADFDLGYSAFDNITFGDPDAGTVPLPAAAWVGLIGVGLVAARRRGGRVE